MFIFYLLFFFLVSYFLSSVSRQMWFLLRPIVVHQNEIQKSTQKKTGRGVVNIFYRNGPGLNLSNGPRLLTKKSGPSF